MRNWWMILGWAMAATACDDAAPVDGEMGIAADAQPTDAGLDAADDAAEDAAPADPTLPSACLSARPCGGDLQGEWTWQAWCRDVPPEPVDACVFAEMTEAIVPVGTVRFDPDGTYVTTATYTIRRQTVLPMECVSSTCEATAADLSDERDWVCAVDGDECVCVAEQSLPGDDAGTYTIDSTTVTTRGPDDEPRPLWFCVDGDTLMLRDLDADSTSDPVFVLHR